MASLAMVWAQQGPEARTIDREGRAPHVVSRQFDVHDFYEVPEGESEEE